MSNEVIVFPDAETLIVRYLNTAFLSYGGYTSPLLKAYTKVPKTRPDRFVKILRVGGTQKSLVQDTPTLAVESWSTNVIEAANIAQLVRGLLHAIDTVTYQTVTYQFYRPQEFSGPANLPDPDSAQERYTQTFSVGVRGSAL